MGIFTEKLENVMEREYYMLCIECKDVVCTVMGVRLETHHDDYVKKHIRETGHNPITFTGISVTGTSQIRKLLRGE